MKISRRAILLGGAATAVAVPVGSHFWWASKDYVRDDYAPGLPEAPTGERAWSNWSGIQKATPREIMAPVSTQELAENIQTAAVPIRPVGSGHSFTGLVPVEGTMIDISALSGLITHDSAEQTASLGAGTRLQQAARLLSEQGLGFANLPDIDVQTLAGGYATATHGTGRELTAIHDYVQGFEIVTPEGEILEASATLNPELFQAGKVSLGALGVITRYDLKLQKAFNLRRQTGLEKLDSLLGRFDALSKKHRNFEIYYFPHTGYAAWIIHDIHEGPVEGKQPSEDEDILGGLKQLRDTLGWWPWLRRRIAQGEFEEGLVEDTTDAAWKLLSTSRPTKFNEIEYHMPLDKGLDTLREVIDRLEMRKDSFFPLECRITAPDDAWLSPFNDGPRISIAVHAAENEDYSYFFDDIEPLFLKNGGRPHWGKLHSRAARDFREHYPKFDDFNRLRKELDPQGKFVTPYMAKLLGDA